MMLVTLLKIFSLFSTLLLKVLYAAESDSVFYQKANERLSTMACYSVDDKIENPSDSKIECLLFCGRANKKNAYFEISGNSSGKCICTNKTCFKTGYEAYKRVSSALSKPKPDETISTTSPARTVTTMVLTKANIDSTTATLSTSLSPNSRK